MSTHQRVIWKYELTTLTVEAHLHRINIPGNYPRPLCVMVQEGIPCIWIEVDPNSASRPFDIYTFGTGIDTRGPIKAYGTKDTKYVGSYQLEWYVGHIYIGEATL